MTFHPEALDIKQAKRLAKNMSRGSQEVLSNTPLSLTQSQELLARALGYDNWHAFRQGRLEVSPSVNSATDKAVAWKFHERILLGCLIAIGRGQKPLAMHSLTSLFLFFQNPQHKIDAAGNQAEYPGGLIDDLATIGSYAAQHLTQYPNKPVDEALCDALHQARQTDILASANFLWLKDVDPDLWKKLDALGRGSLNADPFSDRRVRRQLFNDLHILIEAAVDFRTALIKVGDLYEKHGFADRAIALKTQWLPELEQSTNWMSFLAQRVAHYDSAEAIRFELMAVAGSGQDAMRTLIANMQKMPGMMGDAIVN